MTSEELQDLLLPSGWADFRFRGQRDSVIDSWQGVVKKSPRVMNSLWQRTIGQFPSIEMIISAMESETPELVGIFPDEESLRRSQHRMLERSGFSLHKSSPPSSLFLVIVQRSRAPLATPALENAAPSGFDLWFNFYDGVPPANFGNEAQFVSSCRGSKATFAGSLPPGIMSFLEHYEWILFLDDDVEINASALGDLFSAVSGSKLFAAQAAIDEGSPADSYSWASLVKQPGESGIIPISGVEVMAPLLSRQAFTEFVSLSPESHSTWGLDLALGVIAQEKGLQLGLVTDFTMRHSGNSRKGGLYRFLEDNRLYYETEIFYLWLNRKIDTWGISRTGSEGAVNE